VCVIDKLLYNICYLKSHLVEECNSEQARPLCIINQTQTKCSSFNHNMLNKTQ